MLVKMMQEGVQRNKDQAVDRGRLQINVTSEITAYPIENATISISYTGVPNSILEQLQTNQVGQDESLTCGGITVDKTAHRVIIDGKDVDLSYKEFELLTYFMENKGIALSREKILNNVWNYDYFGDARTIDTHVKKLRSKLGEEGNLIKTIWGMGYKMDETAE